MTRHLHLVPTPTPSPLEAAVDDLLASVAFLAATIDDIKAREEVAHQVTMATIGGALS